MVTKLLMRGMVVPNNRSGNDAFYVVTVNYKSLHHLKNLVKSLHGISGLRRLIIIDHSGELLSEDLEADFPIQLIKQANRGYGAGLNRGLQEIPESDALVLMCNPDVSVLTPERVSDVSEYFKLNSRIGALSPKILTQDGIPVSSCRKFYFPWTVLAVRINWLVRQRPKFIKEHYYWDHGFDKPYVGDWGSGAALFCRLSIFPDRKFFDERFFLYFEDVDFATRLWKRGWRIEYFPTFVVQHYEARRSRKNLLFLWRHIASLMRFVVKHRGFPTRESLTRNNKCASEQDKALEAPDNRCASIRNV